MEDIEVIGRQSLTRVLQLLFSMDQRRRCSGRQHRQTVRTQCQSVFGLHLDRRERSDAVQVIIAKQNDGRNEHGLIAKDVVAKIRTCRFQD